MSRQREPFYEELGRRIARLRQEHGWSQHVLGSRMRPQMTRASIANIETGQQRVLAHTFVQLAEVLECDLDMLAGRREAHAAPDSEIVQRELQRKLRHQMPKQSVEELTRSLGLVSSRKPR